jgi:hypothetical protein
MHFLLLHSFIFLFLCISFSFLYSLLFLSPSSQPLSSCPSPTCSIYLAYSTLLFVNRKWKFEPVYSVCHCVSAGNHNCAHFPLPLPLPPSPFLLSIPSVFPSFLIPAYFPFMTFCCTPPQTLRPQTQSFSFLLLFLSLPLSLTLSLLISPSPLSTPAN